MRMRPWISAGASALLAVTLLGSPVAAKPAASGGPHGGFDVQAHRGGLGLRSESTLNSFRDLGKLVKAAGASTVSSNWQVHDPDQPLKADPDWYLRTNPAYFHGPVVEKLRKDGLKVVPYTINDAATVQRLIDLRVDGIISDDPDLVIAIARKNGLR